MKLKRIATPETKIINYKIKILSIFDIPIEIQIENLTNTIIKELRETAPDNRNRIVISNPSFTQFRSLLTTLQDKSKLSKKTRSNMSIISGLLKETRRKIRFEGSQRYTYEEIKTSRWRFDYQMEFATKQQDALALNKRIQEEKKSAWLAELDTFNSVWKEKCSKAEQDGNRCPVSLEPPENALIGNHDIYKQAVFSNTNGVYTFYQNLEQLMGCLLSTNGKEPTIMGPTATVDEILTKDGPISLTYSGDKIVTDGQGNCTGQFTVTVTSTDNTNCTYIKYADGRKYVGDARDNLPHGIGRMEFPADSYRRPYNGHWKDGKRHGWEYFSQNGKTFSSRWRNGEQIDFKVARAPKYFF